MKEDKTVPQLRFPEFTDAWKQRKLEQIIDVGSGRDYKHLSEGGIPVYGTGGYMLSVNEALSWEEDAIGIGRKGTIDKPYILQAPFWTVDTLFYAIPKKEQDLDFLYCIFQNIDWKKKDESTGVPSLSKTIINKTYCMTPNYDEQKKIGCFFSKIDNLITLQQRKLNSLQKLKKGLLQKMFPKKGENIPEIRFPEFSDAWKQRKLCEFVNFYSGLTYKPENVNQRGTFVLRSSNVKNGEILDADNVYVNEDIAKSEKVQLGDIIVVVRNGSRDLIGKHATVKRSMPNTVIGAFMTGIRAKEYSFVNALLDTNQFEKEINKNLGATINQITGYMFSNMSFTIPSEEEQHKIGSFFTQLDNTITLQQRKLESLQKLKKGLLQQMFI